jgi:FMN reductase
MAPDCAAPGTSEERAGSTSPRAFIVGIGGTLRPASTTERVLRYTLGLLATGGAEVHSFIGPELARLPMFDPNRTVLDKRAVPLVAALRKADAIVLVTPAYHSSVSGLLKNALDYVEELRADPRPYFDGLPVGCVAIGAGWQASTAALHELRTIAHALRGWPTPFGAALNSADVTFDDRDDVVDSRIREHLQMIADQIMRHTRAYSQPPRDCPRSPALSEPARAT